MAICCKVRLDELAIEVGVLDMKWIAAVLGFVIVYGAAWGQEVDPEVLGDKPASSVRRGILFFGDSLTAGYGVEREEANPALIQARIDSLGWNFEVFNAGLGGETSAGGLRRIDWLLRRPIEVFVLELGANDGLRGIDLKDTRANLQQIIDRVKAKNPAVALVVAGMQMPPNLGPEYTEEFRRLFTELAKKNDAALIPFLLEGVADKPLLNLPDGNHPTAEGHRIVAATVWTTLGPVLKALWH